MKLTDYINLAQRVKISGSTYVSVCRPKEQLEILPLLLLCVSYVMLATLLPVSKRVAFFIVL